MAQLPPKLPSVSAESKVLVLKRIRTLSHLLDNAIPIPGTTYRIGIDPLLGLLPGAGDILGAGLSAYIVLEAARFGLPRATLARMAFNIASETALGSLPVLGDFFDATWKANTRNIALLETHLDRPRPNQATNWWFLILLLTGLMVFVIGLVVLGVLLFERLLRAVGS
jgi:hypothetical protein